jgi:hypothetical protein
MAPTTEALPVSPAPMLSGHRLTHVAHMFAAADLGHLPSSPPIQTKLPQPTSIP